MGAEGESRQSWGRHIEFIITCIGFAVGLGNVWRFPHLAFENGGGAFLIPYAISLVFMGIPLFCLEILFGQFASLGPISIWTINPLFKGLGFTMVVLAAVISIYYNVVVATAIYFLFASMQDPVPWSTCGNDWNTCFCRTSEMNITLSDPLMWFHSNGLDCTGVVVDTKSIKSSSEEFYYNKVLESTGGIFDLGKLKWDMTLCNLLAWIIICAALIKGVQTMGKAVYFFALFPYVLLTVLLVRGVTLEGSTKGINYYLEPKPEKLTDPGVWKAAASQIFFSLSCCTGSLTAMSSYNKFHNNVLRDSLIIPVINCLTSFYAGFAIFSVLGFMSHNTGVEVRNVTSDGPGLVFVAYPEALSQMPVPQLWSILFFFMMICLGMGTQFPSVETVMTGLQDEVKFLRSSTKVNVIFRIVICVLGFLLGLPMTTQGGTYVLDLCDIFVGYPLLLVGFFEIVAIVWVYGFFNFKEDVLMMVGERTVMKAIFYFYYSWNWLFVTPVLILVIIIYDSVEYEPITSAEYPEWAEGLGWVIVGIIMIWLPGWYIGRYLYEVCCVNPPENGKRPGEGAADTFIRMNRPTIEWGPALSENREGVPRYRRLLEQRGYYETPKGEALSDVTSGPKNEKSSIAMQDVTSQPPAYNESSKYAAENQGFYSENEPKLSTNSRL